MLRNLINSIKENAYGYFAFKVAIFLLTVFLTDFIVGNTLRYFYFNQQSGEMHRTIAAIEQSTADIMVFGSSRATHHYNPNILEEGLNKTCYVAGQDGNFLIYHYGVLKAVLARHKPKIVILDIVAQEFTIDQSNYDRLSVLLPYYKNHPEMRDIMLLKSSTEKIKLLSQIYPFNSTMFTIAIGNTEFNKKRKPDINGFVPIKKKLRHPFVTDNLATEYKTDSIKLAVYKSFINDCTTAGAKLIIACSPYYIKYNDPIYSLALAKNIAKENNVLFLDHSQDSLFLNSPQYFADNSHLNEEGAKVYTEILVRELSDKLSN